jgi:hypothetical protein
VEVQIIPGARADCDRPSCPLQLGIVLPGKVELKLLPQGYLTTTLQWIIFSMFLFRVQIGMKGYSSK